AILPSRQSTLDRANTAWACSVLFNRMVTAKLSGLLGPPPEEPSEAESEIVWRFLAAGDQHGTIGAIHYLAANITEHVRAQAAAQGGAGDHQIVAAFADFAQDFSEHRATSQMDLGCHS